MMKKTDILYNVNNNCCGWHNEAAVPVHRGAPR